MIIFLKKYAEPIIWNGALLALGFMKISEGGFSLCLLKNLGISWCPGCGLGHAIHHALHFNFGQSLQAHMLGIPATLILFYQSCKSIYTINKIHNNGPTSIIKNVS